MMLRYVQFRTVKPWDLAATATGLDAQGNSLPTDLWNVSYTGSGRSEVMSLDDMAFHWQDQLREKEQE
jgi:hypothetical protein